MTVPWYNRLMLDSNALQADFPILRRKVHNMPLIYLDNAATSQKPEVVIGAISEYYRHHNANVHRGVHQLGDESTQAFHTARRRIAAFLGAQVEELIVVRNTTEAANQVAYTWGAAHITPGDAIISTEMEHHSNLVPWQELARRQGAELVFIQVTPDGQLDLNHYQQLLTEYGEKVKLLAFTHVSNTLGTLNPVADIVSLTRQHQRQTKSRVAIFIDGAQAAPHLPVLFDDLDVEFYAISAHKMLGPMGMGGLLIKQELLSDLTPFLFGGGMINEVSLETTSLAEDLEDRFTAGTPDVAGLVGWAAACDYLSQFSWSELLDHDQALVEYTLTQLKQFPQVQIIGPTDVTRRVGSVAFVYQGVHAHDVGQILDSVGVAVRSGHHCTMPLHTKFGWQATVRVSFQLYNTTADVDAVVTGLKKVQTIFGK